MKELPKKWNSEKAIQRHSLLEMNIDYVASLSDSEASQVTCTLYEPCLVFKKVTNVIERQTSK